jgi:tetraacyldisaccharide 4'-kinase
MSFQGLGPAAAPLGALFAAAVRLRSLAYARGWLAVRRAGIPVVSVGGLEVGGTGKTPVARALLGMLLELGARPGLASRGYGRQGRGLVLRRPGEPIDATRIGDEPALIAERHDVAVAVSADRVRAALALCELGCEVVVLDDGFSHRRLHRDLDILVLRPGTRHMRPLPAGTLREPWAHHLRAHQCWGYGGDDGNICVRLRLLPLSLAEPVTAVAGIAHPEAFRTTLIEAGLTVHRLIAFPDHHAYSARDRAMLRALRGPVVVTEKDAVKLRDVAVHVAHTDLEFVSGRALVEAALGGLVATASRSL